MKFTSQTLKYIQNNPIEFCRANDTTVTQLLRKIYNYSRRQMNYREELSSLERHPNYKRLSNVEQQIIQQAIQENRTKEKELGITSNILYEAQQNKPFNGMLETARGDNHLLHIFQQTLQHKQPIDL